MPNVKQFHNNPRDYALEMVEEGRITLEFLAVALIKYMSHDDVRGALEANEVDPDNLDVECGDCQDPDFKGMDGEFDDDGYGFTCQSCLDERDDDDDDEDDD